MSLDASFSRDTNQLAGHRVSHHPKRAGNELITDASSQILSIALAFVAVAVYAVVIADGNFDWISLTWLAGQFSIMMTGAWIIRRQAHHREETPIVAPLIVVVGLLALVWEGFSRTFLPSGLPFELLTMSVIRNLVLILAVVSVWSSYQSLCVALSLFLAMFGITASHDVAAQWLAGLFAIGAVSWLVASHWENVRRRLHGRDQSRRTRTVLLIPILLLLILGVGLASTDRRVTTALRGFLPSSGGDGESAPYARDGVGDGEMLVAGTNRIQSFAPIDDAPFMQDDQPSLYDLFDDTYEEEAKISKTDRAVALPSDLANRAKEHLHNRTEKANREFSTLRQSREDSAKRNAPNIHGNALFYVAGRVPLHLRLQVYDLFDGIDWYPEENPEYKRPLEISTSDGKPWLELSDRVAAREYLSQAETHALKIVNFESNTIPAPLYLHGVHIDLVDRADMFQHGPGGLVNMNRERLPALVPIHLATRAVDLKQLSGEEKIFLRLNSDAATSVIPQSIDDSLVKELADRMSRNKRAGWDQISAIAQHLRTEYVLDPDWRPVHDAVTPVEEFLFSSKRGPDYQFATATALLLRSLGYSSRIVSGFYADPQQYNSRSRHTPVLADDVHFWTEVRVGGEDWVTVEATPGYEVLGPPPSLFQRITNSIIVAMMWVFRNWLGCSIGLSTLLVLHRNRIQLKNLLYTFRWRLGLWWKPQTALVRTLKLLRQRAELLGTAPKKSTTHHRWIGEMMARANDTNVAQSLYALRKLIDSAAYAPLSTAREEDCVQICQTCQLGCGLKWFQTEYQQRQAADDQNQVSQTDRTKHVEYAGAAHHER